jgi:hypothetical protein
MRRSTVLMSATIGIAVLYLAGAVALGTPPDATDRGEDVVSWFRQNSGHVHAWIWFGTLTLPLVAVFASFIRNRLSAPYGDVFFFGMVAFATQSAVYAWIWGGLAWHTATLQPATARLVLDVASYWGPVLTGSTVMTLGPVVILAIQRRDGLPQWLGILSAVALVEQLVETITIFGNRGFTAPGGPMNNLLGAGLVAVSWLSLGIVVARKIPDDGPLIRPSL